MTARRPRTLFRFMLAAALLALTAVAGGFSVTRAASAADDVPGEGTSIPRPVVGVIDLQRILREADAAQNVRQQREKYVTAYQADAARVEQELRAADQELARLRNSADPEDFAARRSAFQKRVAESQRRVQQRRRNLERAYGKAMSAVQQATIRIADEIAAEKGVNVILYRSQVFLFDNAMDLTEDILTRLDARMPTVEFPDPEAMDDESHTAPDAPDTKTGD